MIVKINKQYVYFTFLTTIADQKLHEGPSIEDQGRPPRSDHDGQGKPPRSEYDYRGTSQALQRPDLYADVPHTYVNVYDESQVPNRGKLLLSLKRRNKNSNRFIEVSL